MAKANEYQEQYRYKGRDTFAQQKDGNYSRVASAIAQSGSGEALEYLGKSGVYATRVLGKAYNDRQNARVNEAVNELQSSFTAWQAEASKKKGKDALTTAEEYNKFKERSISTFTDGMNNTERGRFDLAANRILASQGAWAEKYEFTEEQSYLDANDIASFKNASQQIISFPESYGAEIERVDSLVNAHIERKGLSEEAGESYRRDIKSAVYTDVINSRINSGNLGGAYSMLQQSKGSIGGEVYSAFDKKIKDIREANYKKAVAEQKKAVEQKKNLDIQTSYTDIMSIVGQYPTLEESTSKGYQLINEIQDPEIKKKVYAMFKGEMSFQESMQKANAQAEASAFEKSVIGQSPAQIEERLLFETMSDEARGLVRKDLDETNQLETPGNREEFNTIMSAIDDREKALNPMSEQELNAFLYDSSMTTKQKEEVAKYFDTGGAVGNLKHSQLTEAWKKATGKQASKMTTEFTDYISSNLPSGKEATASDVQKIAARYLMSGQDVSDKSNDWFGDGVSYGNISYVEAEKAGKLADWLPEVEESNIALIDTQLKSLGVPVSDYNRAVYKKVYMMDIDYGNTSFEQNKKAEQLPSLQPSTPTTTSKPAVSTTQGTKQDEPLIDFPEFTQESDDVKLTPYYYEQQEKRKLQQQKQEEKQKDDASYRDSLMEDYAILVPTSQTFFGSLVGEDLDSMTTAGLEKLNKDAIGELRKSGLTDSEIRKRLSSLNNKY